MGMSEWTGPPPGLFSALASSQAMMRRDHTEIDRLVREHDDLLSAIMENAPPCWGDADPIIGVALAYVRSLEGTGENAMIGHAEDCRCPGNYPNQREV